jgi:hypothetical protein
MQTGTIAAPLLADHRGDFDFRTTALQQHPNNLPLFRAATASYALAEQNDRSKKIVARMSCSTRVNESPLMSAIGPKQT